MTTEELTSSPQVVSVVTTLPKVVHKIYDVPSAVASSCVKYVRLYIPDLPRIVDPSHLDPNTDPAVGTAALFTYNEPHIAVVTAMSPTGIWVIESNFHHGKVGERFVPWTAKELRGFYLP